jgi:GNAT superfamily N-acetyltransferase
MLRALRAIHDRDRLRAALHRDRGLQLYALGDLDPAFWPRTTWYASGGEGELAPLDEVALLYDAGSQAVLLALTPGAPGGMAALLGAIAHLLPRRFYAHLSPGLASALIGAGYRAAPRGAHRKMLLATGATLDSASAERLSRVDLSALLEFYRQAYPGNWFDPRMVDTGQYFGVREEGRLVAVAGVHVYAPSERVAALGNIATLPGWRGRGLAGRVTAALCSSLLLEQIDCIGLNVAAQNAAAIACYQRLGFSPCGRYEEWQFES